MVVNVKPAEHALDRDRLGRVDDHHRIHWYALAESLMRPTFVEVACILPKERREMLVVDEQHVVKYLSARAAHKRSATEFIFGARTAVLITFAPTPCAARSNAGPNLSSRSRSSTAAHARPSWHCAAAVRSTPGSDDVSLQRGPRAATPGGR